MSIGAFTFVLNSHIPYCRRAGRWPHGEEWLHEAVVETYIPLLNTLNDIISEGVRPQLTISFSPILIEQLVDTEIIANFEKYLNEKIARIEKDMVLSVSFEANNSQRLTLSNWYCDWYKNKLNDFVNRYKRDVIGAFRQLQDQGAIEIITSMATHCYAPLIEHDSTLYAQLKIGLDSYMRHFGHNSKGIWLPECAYRPAYFQDRTNLRKPGLEEFLEAQKIEFFLTETYMIEGGYQRGIKKRNLDPVRNYNAPIHRTTYQPYSVASSNVVAIGRNYHTGMQVWSSEYGYPGDGNYREFHKKDSVNGLQYWRITDKKSDLEHKDIYNLVQAQESVNRHASHFVEMVERLFTSFYAQTGKYGLVASCYDTELFGHWWFEGTDWLKQVLIGLSRSEIVELKTIGNFLKSHPPRQSIVLPEGSWGWQGSHATWINKDTDWMWPLIHQAELEMEKLVARYYVATYDIDVVMQQIARELLLLESSDWPFLISVGTAREYSTNRFQKHLARFNNLCSTLESGKISEAREMAEEYFIDDNPFPSVNWKAFAGREGKL